MAIAVGVVAAWGLPGAVFSFTGAMCGAFQGGFGAYLHGGNFGDIILGAGVGALFGAICPWGGIGSMVGSAMGYSIARDYFGGSSDPTILARGWDWGGLIGGVAGSVPYGLKAVVPELAGGALFGGAGLYVSGGNWDAALAGASFGMMVGGIGGGIAGRRGRITGKFRGDPFAYGTGSRSARATALVDDAANAAGIKLADYVDEVLYWPGASKFDVIRGKRLVFIGASTFTKTRAGQLVDALHEIGHAEVFAKRVRRVGWARAVDETIYSTYAHGPLYYYEEQVVERLARMRAGRYLGGLNPQQYGASTRYINRSRQNMLEEEQLFLNAGLELPPWPYRMFVQ